MNLVVPNNSNGYLSNYKSQGSSFGQNQYYQSQQGQTGYFGQYAQKQQNNQVINQQVPQQWAAPQHQPSFRPQTAPHLSQSQVLARPSTFPGASTNALSQSGYFPQGFGHQPVSAAKQVAAPAPQLPGQPGGPAVEYKNQKIPNFEPTQTSHKPNGVIKAFATNTNTGLFRTSNEDRVSIILNMVRPTNKVKENWPRCYFFSVYDGHGGANCADFLRDQLHNYIIRDNAFPHNVQESIKNACKLADQHFLEGALTRSGTNSFERSGSCAIATLFVGDMCYVINVGDSRAVMSVDGGSRTVELSRDHKPLDDLEYKRILQAGGSVHQLPAPAMGQGLDASLLAGPHRVFPGRLSVCRTFGDLEAKHPKYGGNPNVVICTPDVHAFKLSPEQDFVVLACDGIFDTLSTEEVIKTVWDTAREGKAKNINELCGLAVENIMKHSLAKNTLDNVSVVIVAFESFVKKLFPEHAIEQEVPSVVTVNNKENFTAPAAQPRKLSGIGINGQVHHHPPTVSHQQPHVQQPQNHQLHQTQQVVPTMQSSWSYFPPAPTVNQHQQQPHQAQIQQPQQQAQQQQPQQQPRLSRLPTINGQGVRPNPVVNNNNMNANVLMNSQVLPNVPAPNTQNTQGMYNSVALPRTNSYTYQGNAFPQYNKFF